MTDASDATYFSVNYTEAELRDGGRLDAKKQARAESNYTFFGMLFAVPIAVGLAVFAGSDLGLIPDAAVPAALATAYIAFGAGWSSYWLWIRSYYRKQSSIPRDLGPWNFVFDDAGIVYRNETTEVRFTWRGVDKVEHLGPFVVFRCGRHRIFIPSRIFADTASRAAFGASCAVRIKAAAKSA